MSFMDKAKDMVDKIEDKIPASVKDKIPDSVKDKLGIDDDEAAGAPDPVSTDPGSVSDIAAATSSAAADTARTSSVQETKDDPDGTDPHSKDAPGAGRSSVTDIGGD